MVIVRNGWFISTLRGSVAPTCLVISKAKNCAFNLEKLHLFYKYLRTVWLHSFPTVKWLVKEFYKTVQIMQIFNKKNLVIFRVLWAVRWIYHFSYLGIEAILPRAAQSLFCATAAPRVPSEQRVLQLLGSRANKALILAVQMDLIDGKKYVLIKSCTKGNCAKYLPSSLKLDTLPDH